MASNELPTASMAASAASALVAEMGAAARAALPALAAASTAQKNAALLALRLSAVIRSNAENWVAASPTKASTLAFPAALN